MKMYRKLYKTFLFLPVIFSAYCNAQFAFKSALGEVKESGFHKIMMLPSITAKSNADLSDIRVIDAYGKGIPYILKREKPLINRKELKEFPIISITKSKDSNTQIILQSALSNVFILQQADYSFVLVIKNADAYRGASIKGSDDMKKWYAISDKIILGDSENGTGDEYLQVISLPPVRYQYLNITIQDKGRPPLNIVKAGMLLTKDVYGKYTELPSPHIEQRDSSNKKSYVALHFKEAYPVSKLRFAIHEPSLYKRKITVYDTSGVGSKIISEGILQPGTDSLIVYGDKCRDMVVVVENNDDQPLQFGRVQAFQSEQYIIANLEAGKKYFILTGYREAGAPVYDLQYFSEKIKIVGETLETGALEKNEAISKMPVLKKVLITSLWVWAIMIIVLLLLLLLTFRLIKNIPKKHPQNDRI